MNKQPPITKRIKHLFSPPKGVQPHKLYPKEYFKQYWFNEPDSKGIELVAKIKGMSKKEAAHFIFEQGFKRIMGQLVKEELELMDTPEGQAQQAKHTRFYL